MKPKRSKRKQGPARRSNRRKGRKKQREDVREERKVK